MDDSTRNGKQADPLRRAFATCPKGLEGLLAVELDGLGAVEIRETLAGVGFQARLESLYRICLWSRLANRVLLALAEIDVRNTDELYAGVRAIEWGEHLTVAHTIAVDFSGVTPSIRNTRFGALKVKDAIVDYFREREGQRPSVDTAHPDIRVNTRLRHDRAIVSLDLSGASLHRRGYRRAGGAAPLKENLASALLLRAGWPDIAAHGGALVDPMCGSGTLLIEAALMAMGIAPGFMRRGFGFERWLGHCEESWAALREAAEERRAQALRREWPPLIGHDAEASAVSAAKHNIERCGLASKIRVSRGDVSDLMNSTRESSPPGLVITNPPYGARLGEEAALVPVYHALGSKLIEEFRGWKGAVVTGNPELGKTMGIRAARQYRFLNGAIAARLLLFDIEPGFVVRAGGAEGMPCDAGVVLSKGARMFANRLQKNLRRLRKWRQSNAVRCYRLYDADMPEYAVAVDVYQDWAHVAEYKPPQSVDAGGAQKRLREVMTAIPGALDIPAEHIVVKHRARQRGHAQYEKHARGGKLMRVEEGAAALLVNLHDYLDTGLYLDHRPLRLALASLAREKRFLNLFCYTAAATVHAALGGARESLSVDASATYINWARRNLAANGIDAKRHVLLRADCLQWLASNQQAFDLVLLDPPTFSNSKSRTLDLDIQRDHAALIEAAMRSLAPEGLLIFSTNRARFRLDPALQSRFAIEDVTSWSLDEDFRHARHAHRCWFVRHLAAAH